MDRSTPPPIPPPISPDGAGQPEVTEFTGPVRHATKKSSFHVIDVRVEPVKVQISKENKAPVTGSSDSSRSESTLSSKEAGDGTSTGSESTSSLSSEAGQASSSTSGFPGTLDMTPELEIRSRSPSPRPGDNLLSSDALETEAIAVPEKHDPKYPQLRQGQANLLQSFGSRVIKSLEPKFSFSGKTKIEKAQTLKLITGLLTESMLERVKVAREAFKLDPQDSISFNDIVPLMTSPLRKEPQAMMPHLRTFLKGTLKEELFQTSRTSETAKTMLPLLLCRKSIQEIGDSLGISGDNPEDIHKSLDLELATLTKIPDAWKKDCEQIIDDMITLSFKVLKAVINEGGQEGMYPRLEGESELGFLKPFIDSLTQEEKKDFVVLSAMFSNDFPKEDKQDPTLNALYTTVSTLAKPDTDASGILQGIPSIQEGIKNQKLKVGAIIKLIDVSGSGPRPVVIEGVCTAITEGELKITDKTGLKTLKIESRTEIRTGSRRQIEVESHTLKIKQEGVPDKTFYDDLSLAFTNPNPDF